MFFEFILGYRRSENLNLVSVLDVFDDLVVILAEMVPEAFVARILRCTIPGDNLLIQHIMLHIRRDDPSGFRTLGDTHDNRLVAVDPHAHVLSHCVFLLSLSNQFLHRHEMVR